jgi:hypothetical protein
MAEPEILRTKEADVDSDYDGFVNDGDTDLDSKNIFALVRVKGDDALKNITLLQGGNFIVYNEEFAAQTGAAPVKPEFIMTGKLREQNVRRDNGNFYKENSLMIRLTDVATGLDFWQKRVPLQKAVDKTNVMN